MGRGGSAGEDNDARERAGEGTIAGKGESAGKGGGAGDDEITRGGEDASGRTVNVGRGAKGGGSRSSFNLIEAIALPGHLYCTSCQ